MGLMSLVQVIKSTGYNIDTVKDTAILETKLMGILSLKDNAFKTNKNYAQLAINHRYHVGTLGHSHKMSEI